MNTDLAGMDEAMFLRKRQQIFANRKDKSPEKNRFVTFYRVNIWTSIVDLVEDTQQKPLENVTDEQWADMTYLLRFYLGQYSVFEEQNMVDCKDVCFDVLFMIIVVILRSNKKPETEAFVRENIQELKRIRTKYGESLLHFAADLYLSNLPCIPLVRLLVEEGKMDVNVVNSERMTPLHVTSDNYHASRDMEDSGNKPSQEILKVAELLIENGAHMDMVDVYGDEASKHLSKHFPQWAINSSLQCLAAKVILRHNLPHKKVLPAKLIPFIHTHEQEESEEDKKRKKLSEDEENNGKKRKLDEDQG